MAEIFADFLVPDAGPVGMFGVADYQLSSSPTPTGPPIVNMVFPAPGTAISPLQPAAFDVTSPTGRSFVALLILMYFPNTGICEVAYDGVQFTSNYSGTKAVVTNGYAFTGVVRKSGWPAPPTFAVVAVDSAGLINS